MTSEFQSFDFPKQKIPNSEKTPEWVAQSTDWVIGQGQARRDTADIEQKYRIVQGDLPMEFYKKILNPYNATDAKYTRFPGTLRHHDLAKGIIRRYVSEYLKNPHDFIVGANNPEVLLAKNAKLNQELAKAVQIQIAAKINESYQQWINDGQQPEDFKPQQALDVEAFIKKFNEDYIDDISAQGQQILNVIKDITEDALLYARAYFDFVTFGECFTYTEVIGTELKKYNISVRDAFPIETDNFFREDDDAFAFRRKMTYQQIIDSWDDKFKDKDKDFLEKFYSKSSSSSGTDLAFSVFESYFPEVCNKYSTADKELFKKQATMARDNNGDLYDVWYAFWKGYTRRAIVTFVNEASLIDTREEDDDYELNTSAGDISIEHIYIPQVHQSIRIGGRNDSIYPIGAEAVPFNRGNKLPTNGVSELIPGLGKFSIIEIITPYNVLLNIVYYHREMALAKNKMSILVLAKSLLGKVPDSVLHKMLADGVIYYDDTDDAAGLKAQNIRMLQADGSAYIAQLGVLIAEIEQTAKNQVDMTPQRYGDIANSAGKGTTQEAITRGSMGSVIIEFVMDYMRERDYARDMDFSKFAWIDGLDTSYQDDENNIRYVSLDVDKHNYASYLIKAKKSVNEREKLDQYKQLAFSAAQNGDMDMATAAIDGDNVATISKLIKKYKEEKQAYEMNMKKLEEQSAELAREWEAKKIVLKGDEDRKTLELKGRIEAEIELIQADANMISFDNGVPEADKQAGLQRLQNSRNAVEQGKIKATKEANALNAFSEFQDRKVEREKIAASIKVAGMNKNKYDVRSKKTGKK